MILLNHLVNNYLRDLQSIGTFSQPFNGKIRNHFNRRVGRMQITLWSGVCFSIACARRGTSHMYIIRNSNVVRLKPKIWCCLVIYIAKHHVHMCISVNPIPNNVLSIHRLSRSCVILCHAAFAKRTMFTVFPLYFDIRALHSFFTNFSKKNSTCVSTKFISNFKFLEKIKINKIFHWKFSQNKTSTMNFLTRKHANVI